MGIIHASEVVGKISAFAWHPEIDTLACVEGAEISTYAMKGGRLAPQERWPLPGGAPGAACRLWGGPCLALAPHSPPGGGPARLAFSSWGGGGGGGGGEIDCDALGPKMPPAPVWLAWSGALTPAPGPPLWLCALGYLDAVRIIACDAGALGRWGGSPTHWVMTMRPHTTLEIAFSTRGVWVGSTLFLSTWDDVSMVHVGCVLDPPQAPIIHVPSSSPTAGTPHPSPLLYPPRPAVVDARGVLGARMRAAMRARGCLPASLVAVSGGVAWLTTATLGMHAAVVLTPLDQLKAALPTAAFGPCLARLGPSLDGAARVALFRFAAQSGCASKVVHLAENLPSLPSLPLPSFPFLPPCEQVMGLLPLDPAGALALACRRLEDAMEACVAEAGVHDTLCLVRLLGTLGATAGAAGARGGVGCVGAEGEWADGRARAAACLLNALAASLRHPHAGKVRQFLSQGVAAVLGRLSPGALDEATVILDWDVRLKLDLGAVGLSPRKRKDVGDAKVRDLLNGVAEHMRF